MMLLYLFFSVVVVFFFFFFFQAEDGIRDVAVTGVQTCALPIWVGRAAGCLRRGRGCRHRGPVARARHTMRSAPGSTVRARPPVPPRPSGDRDRKSVVWERV